jgi:mono/diheme cytochrome c family protein
MARVLAAFALLVTGCAREPVYPRHAEAIYVQHCAACHGISGKGDGPAAGALSPPPTDLTKSDLSLAELMKVIDGRRTVHAHGTAAMPVWGEVFEDTAQDPSRQHRQALRDVQAVAEYVQALRARARGAARDHARSRRGRVAYRLTGAARDRVGTLHVHDPARGVVRPRAAPATVRPGARGARPSAFALDLV